LDVEEASIAAARVVQGPPPPVPVRAPAAEAVLTDGAAERALAGAMPLGRNRYKVQTARALVKRALTALA